MKSYEPLDTSADLSEASLRWALNMIIAEIGPPKMGLVLHVSTYLLDEYPSWLDLIRGEWSNGIPMAVRSQPDLARMEWYLEAGTHGQTHRVGSNPP